mgnify:CR=1 FL=1
MRQYTTPEQTAKLIELGFEKPKSYHDIEWDGTEAYDYQLDYSIGELIEMLPTMIGEGDFNGEPLFKYSFVFAGTTKWLVGYQFFAKFNQYVSEREELIDALYEMVVKLKEEGVI